MHIIRYNYLVFLLVEWTKHKFNNFVQSYLGTVFHKTAMDRSTCSYWFHQYRFHHWDRDYWNIHQTLQHGYFYHASTECDCLEPLRYFTISAHMISLKLSYSHAQLWLLFTNKKTQGTSMEITCAQPRATTVILLWQKLAADTKGNT